MRQHFELMISERWIYREYSKLLTIAYELHLATLKDDEEAEVLTMMRDRSSDRAMHMGVESVECRREL